MKTKVLITVKTYPTLSRKYGELVCTAGFKEDGSWIRIYPVPFRSLDFYTRYHKYQWVEIDLVKNTSDPRFETYRPVTMPPVIESGEIVGIDDSEWSIRRDLVLKKTYTNLSNLIHEAKDKLVRTSLAVFKPSKILDFHIERVTDKWKNSTIEILKQQDLFDDTSEVIKLANKLPYKFSYQIVDDEGRKSTMMIEDWEIGALYWNCLKLCDGDEGQACNKVKEKYLNEIAMTKDVHLFLGTTKSNHFRAPNPFIIIGVFYPAFVTQEKLF